LWHQTFPVRTNTGERPFHSLKGFRGLARRHSIYDIATAVQVSRPAQPTATVDLP